MGLETEKITKKQRRELRRQEKLSQREKVKKRQTVFKVVVYLISFILVAGGIYFTVSRSGSNVSNIVSSAALISDQDHVKGDKDAKIVLIEYSDFQCPACAFYASLVNQLMDENGDSVAFAYRYFPLRSIHRNAQLAAQAAEAAGQQGKFWEMHDKLFNSQDEWEDKGSSQAESIFFGYAADLGLDRDKFAEAISSKAVIERVNSDYQSGQVAGITYTPTFFLNGKKISNPKDLDGFKKLISEKLFSQGEHSKVQK